MPVLAAMTSPVNDPVSTPGGADPASDRFGATCAPEQDGMRTDRFLA